MCKISAKNIKYSDWSSSKLPTEKPGYLEIGVCLDLGIGFCIIWLVLSNYKKIVVSKYVKNETEQIKKVIQ